VITLVKELGTALVDAKVADEPQSIEMAVKALESVRKEKNKTLNWMSNNSDVVRDLAKQILPVRRLPLAGSQQD